MEKVTNGMRFKRWQLPLRLMFAGTVHRSQGMTLGRVVVDCRSNFWEHGQLYVALSRVRDPRDLCILLPRGLNDIPIKIPCDREVVGVVEQMSAIGIECMDRDCVRLLDDGPVEVSGEPACVLGQVFNEKEDLNFLADSEKDVERMEEEPAFGSASNSCVVVTDGTTLEKSVDFEISHPSDTVDLQVLIRSGVKCCLKWLCEAQVASCPSMVLSHACDRAAVLCARMLVAWRCRREQVQMAAKIAGDSAVQVQTIIGTGLLNTANNCYLNAVIQVLFHLLPVRNLIMSWPGENSVAAQLRLVFMNLSRARLICPAFMSGVCEPGEDRAKDCSEFALNLLSIIRLELDGPFKGNLERLVYFEIVRRIVIGDEEEMSVDDPGPILTLYSENNRSLNAALEDYFMPHEVLGRFGAMEKFMIRRLPKFLLIHVDRHRVVNGRIEKDCRSFEFSDLIDVRTYRENPGDSGSFRICAVISHLGLPGVGIGHYVAFCKGAEHWVCFNDADVRVVTEAQAVQENFPVKLGSNQTAVMLIYCEVQDDS
jgi:hypothetical protein